MSDFDEDFDAYTSDGEARPNHGGDGDNYGVAAEELRQFVERIEALEAEKKEVSDQIKETYAELKGRGFDTKAIRTIIALRKRDQDEVDEEAAILEIYKQALGM